MTPPAVLMEPTPFPSWHGRTNGDLERYARRLEKALDSANEDKKALRDWAGGVHTMGKSD